MSRYKMVHVNIGDDVQVSFVCQHCAINSQPVHLEPAERHRTFSRRAIGGECSRCSGTGFDPTPHSETKICKACGGTAVCPHCGGNYLRNWNELPFEAQERFLKHWEADHTYPTDYAAFGRFYTREEHRG